MNGYALVNGHKLPLTNVEMLNEKIVWTFSLRTRGRVVWPTQTRIEVRGGDDSLIFIHPSGFQEVATDNGFFTLSFDHKINALEAVRPGVWVR